MYNEDQPRDERGRWGTTGRTAGDLRGERSVSKLGGATQVAKELKREFGYKVTVSPGYEKWAVENQAALRRGLDALKPLGDIPVKQIQIGPSSGLSSFLGLGGEYDNTAKTVSVVPRSFPPGHLVSDSPEHLLMHEMVHAAHAAAQPELWTSTRGPTEWIRPGRRVGVLSDMDRDRAIASRVSRYAAENPAEFVAETGAAMLRGKRYDDEVTNLYNAYRGPRIR